MIELAIAAAAASQAAGDPFSYSFATYAWVIGWAMAGGVVSFISKVKTGHVRAFNVVELLGEIVISGFVGVITFWLCEAAHVDRLLSAVFIAVSGHMGSRAMFMFEKFMARWLERRFGVRLDDGTKGQ